MPPKIEAPNGLKPGSAAPLHGALGHEVAGLLQSTMQVATVGLVHKATLQAGLHVDADLTAAAPSKPSMQQTVNPHPYHMKMPKLDLPGAGKR